MSFVNLESVSLADGAQLDGFGRLRTSMPTTLFDSQQEYGLCTRRCWDGVIYDASGAATAYTITNPSSNGSVTDAAGNAIGPRATNSRMVPITVTGDTGDYAILQTRNYFRYIPGKSQLVFVTGIFATGASPTVKLTRRTSTSGSIVDNEVPQSEWNIDGFNSSLNDKNPSGVTLDFTKTQIMVIDAQWLGVGRVRVGFDIDGVLYVAHEFLNANTMAVPYTQHFNLPVRLEARTTSGTTKCRVGYFDSANGIYLETARAAAATNTIYLICCSVQSEGGEESRGFPHSVSNAISGTTVTGTRQPVLSIRPAALHNFLTNRAHVEKDEFELTASSNSVYWELIIGGTLTGASWIRKGVSITAGSFVTGLTYVITTIGSTDFTLIGAASNTVGLAFTATGAGAGTGTAVQSDSVVEYDVTASAVTGGVTVVSGYVVSGGGGGRGVSSGEADIRNALTISQIDALATTQPAITLACTKFSGANPVVNAAMNWHEQVV